MSKTSPKTVENKTPVAAGDQLSESQVDAISVESAVTEELKARQTEYDRDAAKVQAIATGELPPAPIGHNQPPAENGKTVDTRVADALSHYRPILSHSKAEAEAICKETLYQTAEAMTQSETSIRARVALSAADYCYYNTAELGAVTGNGPAAFHVTRDMETSLSRVMAGWLVADDQKDAALVSTSKGVIPGAVRDALLIMAGLAFPGYFVLPSSRRRLSATDRAMPLPPAELPEGSRVFQAVCVPGNVLCPVSVTKDKQGNTNRTRNKNDQLVLLPVNTAKFLLAKLWDEKGALEYSDTTGFISGFKSGTDVERDQKIAVAAERLRQEQAAKASETGLVKGRETGGNADNGKTPEERAKALQAENKSLRATIAKDQAELPNALKAIAHDRTTDMTTHMMVATIQAAELVLADRLIPNFRNKAPDPHICQAIADLRSTIDECLQVSDDGTLYWIDQDTEGKTYRVSEPTRDAA